MPGVIVSPMLIMGLMFFAVVFAGITFIVAWLGGPVLRGRMPGDGSWYLLYGAITKFGYTTDVVGNILGLKLGKSRLRFIVNPAHKTYLWGKPFYILSVEYGTSIHPSMMAILSALKEMGQDELIKQYLDLNYTYNTILNSLQQGAIKDEEKEKANKALEQIAAELAELEGQMRSIVDKNAHVVEVKEDLSLEELSDGKAVYVVRQLNPDLIGEYTKGVSSPKLTANMDLYAMHMSSIFHSDAVKIAFAAFIILIGVAAAYMLLHGQSAPHVNVQITPETLKALANQTAHNTTKVVHL